MSATPTKFDVQAEWVHVKFAEKTSFKDVYGFVAGDDVVRFVGMLANEVLDELGTVNDFLGHAGGDNFIIITTVDKAQAIRQRLKSRFAEEVKSHYNFMDREQGHVLVQGLTGQMDKVPLMTLAVGVVSPDEYQFADIREITELAADARRKDMGIA